MVLEVLVLVCLVTLFFWTIVGPRVGLWRRGEKLQDRPATMESGSSHLRTSDGARKPGKDR